MEYPRCRMARLALKRAARYVPGACLALVPAVVFATLLAAHDPVRAEATRPLRDRSRDYVGAAACKRCHEDHFASWRRTYHASMTTLPSAETVLGEFDGRTVSAYGASATLREQNGRFLFDLPAIRRDPARTAEVGLVVGSRRYQQYFEREQQGSLVRYRRLPLFWHAGERRFLHLNGAFVETDQNDWGAHRAEWNQNCIFCHNTGVVPGVTFGADGHRETTASRVGDLGIACEACHGPGRDHVEHNRSVVERYRRQLSSRPSPDIVHPERLGQREQNALCGQCHSQRLPDPESKIEAFLASGPSFRPGDDLPGHVRPLTQDTPVPDPTQPDAYRQRFWSDGTARLTSYEYLGVTQSPCIADKRFTCNLCHDMHGPDIEGQITAPMRGDRACTQCHAAIGKNVATHTHHAAASSGSRCLDCHMPRIVYGILDVHRSHRVESPDVKRDIEGGRPNACTQCHVERSAFWAADRMREWWGERYERPVARPGGADLELPAAIAALHAGDPLERLVGVAAFGRPGLALSEPGRPALLANVLVALGDPYGSVRLLARRTARALDQQLSLGLGDALTAVDVQGEPRERTRALGELLKQLSVAASGRVAEPPVGMLVGRDFRLEADTVRALLDRQRSHQVETGE